MKVKILMFIGMFVFGFAAQGEAQTITPNIKVRQIHQQKRIKAGVKSGELTRKETVKLQKQQLKVQRTKKNAKADGVVTRKERSQIYRQQAKASKSLYIAKHNRRNRN